MKQIFTGLLTVLVTLAVPLAASADVVGTLTGDVRITGDLDEVGGGNAGDENGGFTSLVVGINSGNVANWALLGFDTSAGTGQIALGAALTIDVQTGFGGGTQHGSAADTFTLHSLFAGNAGWVPGTGTITNTADNVAPEGVVTYVQQAFGNTTAGTDWVDGSGTDLADFRGSFDTTAINFNTINGWVSGSAPDSITFQITDVALAQSWLDNGFSDLVIQVNDDGNNASRFNLTNESANLVIFTIPEPSSVCVLAAGFLGVLLRRRK